MLMVIVVAATVCDDKNIDDEDHCDHFWFCLLF